MIVRVLQHEHVHAKAAQVSAQALQHVVTHHPQLLWRDWGCRRWLVGLLATRGATPTPSSSSMVGAETVDPCGSLTFLNGRRQWTPYLTRFPTGRVFSPASTEPRGQSTQGVVAGSEGRVVIEITGRGAEVCFLPLGCAAAVSSGLKIKKTQKFKKKI